MIDVAKLPVVIIGAGPVGLAAAAHLVTRGMDSLVLEAGDAPGAAVRLWRHVRLFTPWRYNIDGAARALLAANEWTVPDLDALPTGAELVESYLRPLAELPAIAARLRLRHRVEAISRLGFDRVRSAGRDRTPFVLRVRDGHGEIYDVLARAVIDASGTWGTPNPLGGNGLAAQGESGSAAVLTALPDVLGTHRDRFAGKRTLVVGAGHSAATTLLALADLAETAPATQVTWAIRGASPQRVYGGNDAYDLPARGALGSRLRDLVIAGHIELVTDFYAHTLHPRPDGGVEVVSRDPAGVQQKVSVDVVVNATGFRPDHGIAAELRLDLDPIVGSTRALAHMIDLNHHSCGAVAPHGVDELTHTEPEFYVLGVKSYGRAPTFLLVTGYEQVRSVVAALAGDWTAARDVRLELPEAGVCSTSQASVGPATAVSGGLLLPTDCGGRAR